MSSTALSVRDTALAAYEAGLCVVPPREDGTKAPATEYVTRAALVKRFGPEIADSILAGRDAGHTWKHWQYERPTPQQLKDWYAGGRAGVGTICGAIAGNLEAFEFDDRDTYKAYRDTAEAAGLGDVVERLEDGYLEESPSGGIHWLYRCTEIAGNTELAKRPRPDLGPHRYDVLIETRGEGGYVILAPSGGRVHETGRPYRLLRGSVATIATITPEERAALWELARAFDEMPKPAGDEPAGATIGTATADGPRPGDDFNARATWSEVLEPFGWNLIYRRGDTEFWRRPGKDRGISATINAPGVTADRLYVFSSSTAFEARRSYTKFAAYAVLNHGGDFTAAAAELGRRGYGAAPSRRGPRDNGTSPSEAAPRFPLTDTGNAERLVYRHGKRIRFNWGRGVWYVWDGKRWAEDETGTLERLAKDTIRAIPEEAAGLEGDAYTAVLKWAARSESDGKRQAMIRLARSEPGIPVRPDELDADPWKLNVANGTLDLRTGTLRPHDPGDYITRLIPVDYAPHATCPAFDAFLERIFGGDQDVIAYVWRLIGYSLTGDTREQCIVVCWGTGANGKSTLLGTLHDVLADYAAEADADSFMERKHEGIREDIAALDGARFVSATETSDGKRLSEALVKKMTGGERLRARRLYENGYVFLPQFKVWLATNHKPEIRGGEHAIWRRIKLLPFNVTIPRDEWDTDLRAKLRAEAPGILAKAVRGCLEWQRTGLREPEAVTAATDAYRREMDVLGDWLEDRCILRPGAETAAKALYEDYVRWCQEQGSEPIKQKTFGRRLTDRGCGERKSGSTRYRTGIAFRPQGRGPEPSPDDPGTYGTYGTQDPESPLRKSMGGKFRENASHTSHTSQTNAGVADDWGDVE